MRCKKPTCSGTIRFLHKLFARFGIPDIIVLNNGTQSTVKRVQRFFKAFLIVHITTTWYHLWSYGQAEKFVDTFKRALKNWMGTNPLTISYNF